MKKIFSDTDFLNFWNEHEHYSTAYTDSPASEGEVRAVEEDLGYKLPDAYIELMGERNGGAPIKNCHRTFKPTSWAKDHVAMTGFLSIGSRKPYSLCGEFGSKFMIEEWGYPAIGVYFADCPSAGHDMLCLDYRKCGPQGEPTVVHVDQELDYAVTLVANTFESFVRGLELQDNFEIE